MIYDLPKKLNIHGKDYDIRSDYRAILDILIALKDPELSERDRAAVALYIFYPEADSIPREDLEEALKQCFWFINGGESEAGAKGPRLMDWEQDFKYIAAPVNRVIGREIRDMEYLHWWSFLSAYLEIGDCTFAQIVSIRDKLARHKKLEKYEKDWLNRNRQLVDFKTTYTEAENDILKEWT